jgi:hypothetical protein
VRYLSGGHEETELQVKKHVPVLYNKRLMPMNGWQTTWRVSDRYGRLITVAAEVLATLC